MKTRILIVDDHPVITEGLSQLLTQYDEFEVSGIADSYDSALRAIELDEPDIVIVDIGLSGRSGIDLLSEIKHCFPKLLSVVFSMYDELNFAPRALRAGAKGYVMKSESPLHLVEAIRKIRQGKIAVNDSIKDLIFTHFVEEGKNPEQLFKGSQLTPQEVNIFRLIGNGRNSAQIAARLSISPKTVQTHKDNIRRKLNITTSTELYRHAILFVENGYNCIS